jgi:hypothetical protein
VGGEIGLVSRAGEGSTFHFTVVIDLPANAVRPTIGGGTWPPCG